MSLEGQSKRIMEEWAGYTHSMPQHRLQFFKTSTFPLAVRNTKTQSCNSFAARVIVRLYLWTAKCRIGYGDGRNTMIFFLCQFWKSSDYTLWLINQLKAGSENPPGWNYWFYVLTMIVLNVLLAHTLKGVPTSEAIHSLSIIPDSPACIPLSNCFNCAFPVLKLLL